MTDTHSQNYHHETTRKYTAALLNIFGNAEVQYILSNSELKTVKIPIAYSSREKSRILDELYSEQLESGNMNLLPRGYLSLAGLNRSLERTKNKNLKINRVKTEDSTDYMYNSVPYDFEYTLSYLCRGMNEATQIIEQIVPMFNPNYHIDIYDVINLQEPTRVPLQLSGVFFDIEEYDFLSTNIVTVNFNLILNGNMYMPLKSTPRLKELDLRTNIIIDENSALRNSLLEFDVDYQGEVK